MDKEQKLKLMNKIYLLEFLYAFMHGDNSIKNFNNDKEKKKC